MEAAMKIGFTGTRYGLTDAQRGSLGTTLCLDVGKTDEFHHGSCKGADVEAAQVARQISACKIIAHPGPDSDLQWQTESGVDDETLPGKNHFARNRDIVNACDLLIGCPGIDRLLPTGGTSYTINYAIKHGKPVKIVWPDGRVEDR
jgi:hypothetical protein